MKSWIDNKALEGQGEAFISSDPFSQEILGRGRMASAAQVDSAVSSARIAFHAWKQTAYEQREVLITRFAEEIEKKADELALILAKETGKVFWEAKTEVSAMIGKIPISIRAYHERTGIKNMAMASGKASLRHYPLGVMAVFGPYNFPAHLPNGHIIPALLAGNTVVLKPSEYCPLVSEMIMQIWLQAGLPKGVINLVQGAKDVGEALLKNENIDGVLFTGSAKTGQFIHRQFAGKPEKMLALEMGGNNPLIVSEHYGNLEAAVYTIIQSAFISAGQRCTCARRLFIPRSQYGDLLLEKLIKATKKLIIGGQFAQPEPFMGALICEEAVQNMMLAQEKLLSLGAKALLRGDIIKNALVSPSIIDVTEVKTLLDEEYFAPLLQVIRYDNLTDAIEMANDTKFGLSAGLISTQNQEWQLFLDNIQAGIVNRNRPLTGASSEMPFGGVGASGNWRPSAYYAADYCAYPIASMEDENMQLPNKLMAGVSLDDS